MPKNPYLQTYKKTARETLSPGQLILLLFDTAWDNLNKIEKLFSEDFSVQQQEKIHNTIMKTYKIFVELQNCLDFKPSQELASRLYQLYDYICRQLIQANAKKSVQHIQEARKILEPLRESWREMLLQNPVTS